MGALHAVWAHWTRGDLVVQGGNVWAIEADERIKAIKHIKLVKKTMRRSTRP